jgi:hypothetical protein
MPSNARGMPGVPRSNQDFWEYESMKSRETLIRLKFQVDEKRRRVAQIEA